MPDHVHMVVMLPATISIADMVKQVKGVSSHFDNDELQPAAQFKWHGSYGAFTVSRREVDKIVEYVEGQKQHHAANRLWPEYEETFEEVEATVNER